MPHEKNIQAAVFLAAFAIFTLSSNAALQNVEIGGSVTVLGEYYASTGPVGAGLCHSALSLCGRAVGVGAGNAIVSGFGWDDDGGALSMVTQWTRLHVKAGFTDGVAAFIELDSVDLWGADFRSTYVTSGNLRAASIDDVEIYQAYIEASEMFGAPLRLRAGRQELAFGSEWLVGNNDSGPAPAWGLSFDGLRLTYTAEAFSIDVFWMKLAESGADFAQYDIDFQGVYASYARTENLTLDAYWFWLRDDMPIVDTTGPLDLLEGFFGVDDYDATDLHTIGLRASGARGAFDFESEIACQFGDAGQVGALFVPLNYGDNDAGFDAWGLNLEAGCTFDAAWTPRLYLGYAYFSGQDDRDATVAQRLARMVNPFYTAPASVSFNRLFSDWSYSGILDGSDLSNVHVFRAGIAAAPSEKIELSLDLNYMLSDETFDRPVTPLLSFWTTPNDEELGFEAALAATYQYTEDVYFVVAWDHLFVGDGLAKGNFNNLNGLDFNGGSDGDDADYFSFEMGVAF